MSQHGHHHHHADDEVHDHDRGLAFDLSTLMARRQALRVIGGAGLMAALVGCGGSSNGSDGDAASSSASGGSTSTATTTSAASSETVAAATAASCEAIPEETAGPYPGDGSNGVNVLTESGIVRSDIRQSFGAASAVAEGVPLTVNLTVLDTANGCAPLAGAAVYLWHCDRDGEYSLYSQAIADENYLRGVQETNADGVVSFTTVFPACYSGRWPHIHFEVYPSLEAATGGGEITATSQLAFPADVCDVVYAAEGYEQSVSNMSQVSLESDNVFSDGSSTQLATVTGSVEEGYVAALAVPV